MIGLLVAICAVAFTIGVVAAAVVNYMLLVKWRRETREAEGWYHTWSRH